MHCGERDGTKDKGGVTVPLHAHGPLCPVSVDCIATRLHVGGHVQDCNVIYSRIFQGPHFNRRKPLFRT